MALTGGEIRDGTLALAGLPAVGARLADARPALLVAAAGDRLVWANPAAVRAFGLGGDGGTRGLAAAARRHLAAGRRPGTGVVRLRADGEIRSPSYVCRLEAVTLPAGEAAVLVSVLDPVPAEPADEAARLAAVCRSVAGGGYAAILDAAGAILAEAGPVRLAADAGAAAVVAIGGTPWRLVVVNGAGAATPQANAFGGDDAVATEPPATAQPSAEAPKAAPAPSADAAVEAAVAPVPEPMPVPPAASPDAPVTPPRAATAAASATAQPVGYRMVMPPSRADGDPATDGGSATSAPVAGGRPAVRRFTWQTDADDRFTSVSPELVDALGPGGDIVGLRWHDIAETLSLDPDGRVAASLARRITWSGATVDWPAADGRSVPVDLAGLSVYGTDGRFTGFRGFGTVRPADARPAPAGGLESPPVEPPAAAAPAASAPATAATNASVAAAAVATAPSVAGAPEAMGAAPSGESAASGVAAAVAPDTPASEAEPDQEAFEPAPTGWGATVEPVDATAADAAAPADPPVRAASLRAAAVVNEPTGGVAAAPAAAAPFAPAEQRRTPAENAGSAASGRPSDLAGGTTDPPVGAAEPASAEIVDDDAEAAQQLTRPEWEAFRLVAAALGARFEGDHIVAEPAAGGTTDAVDAANGASAPHVLPPASPRLPPQPAPQAAPQPAPQTSLQPVAADTAEPRRLSAPAAANDAGTAGLIDRIPVALVVCRGEALIHVNPAALCLLGYRDRAELGAAGGLAALFAEPAEAGARRVRVRRSDGSTGAVDARLTSIPWNGGTALLVALTNAAPLAAADGAAAGLLDGLAEAVLVLDAAGAVVAANAASARLLARPRDALEGTAFLDLVAAEGRPAVGATLAGLRNGPAVDDRIEAAVPMLDGDGRIVATAAAFGRITTGDAERLCVVLRDETARQDALAAQAAAASAAEQANAQKSELLARIGHEVRTPINAIVGFAEVMLEERFGPIGEPRYRDYLRDVRASGLHVMSLVDDLLDLARVEAGRADLEFEPVALNDIVRDCVSMLLPKASRDRIIVRTSLAEALPPVLADRRSVKQIVLNLLSNAIKFNVSGGQAIVSTGRDETGGVTLRVRDTGIGMGPADIGLALEPFRRVHGARFGGTGLGLPLTKALAEANAARFTIESEPRQGTLVEIAFPAPRVLAA